MKGLSVVLCLLLSAPASGQQTSERAGERTSAAPPDLVVSPMPFQPAGDKKDDPALEATRLVGSTAAGAGVGLLGFALVAEAAGPVGWAAALIFFGGLSAYLAQRKMSGKEDFPPSQPAAPSHEGQAPAELQPETTFQNPAGKPGV